MYSMKFILGIKKEMSQIFGDDGVVHPVTVVEAGPVTVTAVIPHTDTKSNKKTKVQVGFGSRHIKNVSKPEQGHTKGLGVFRHLKEFAISEGTYTKGDVIDLSIFEKGDSIEVTGISKGKGFQGVVKRHGFHGGPRTHGQKHSEREPGSIGGGLRTRVPKGMRMAGRMGGDRITVKNLKVVYIDIDNNKLFVEGALPGIPGSLLEIKS